MVDFGEVEDAELQRNSCLLMRETQVADHLRNPDFRTWFSSREPSPFCRFRSLCP